MHQSYESEQTLLFLLYILQGDPLHGRVDGDNCSRLHGHASSKYHCTFVSSI